MIARRLAARLPVPVKMAHADLMHQLRWRRSHVAPVTRAFARTHGLVVRGGPFSGMRYPSFALTRGELVVAQLLGAYEQELHPAVERVIAAQYELIVDIGASDGYYAVGFALRSPQATIRAYEMNPFPARVCRALADENGVAERLDLRGLCTTDEMARLPETPMFVLCDSEGAEAELMDPAVAPTLAQATLIVELHEFARPGVTQLIQRRFAQSHDIEIVESTCRYSGDYDLLMEIPDIDFADREIGVSEFRPFRIRWAVMWPRSR